MRTHGPPMTMAPSPFRGLVACLGAGQARPVVRALPSARCLTRAVACTQGSTMGKSHSNVLVAEVPRPAFGKMQCVAAILDKWEDLRRFMEPCDAVAAYFHACRLSKGQRYQDVAKEHPRIHLLVDDIINATSWRAPDVAAACTATRYVTCGDARLHAALAGAAAKKATKMGCRELCDVGQALPLIAKDDAQLQDLVMRQCSQLKDGFSPRELTRLLLMVPSLQPSAERVALVGCLCTVSGRKAPNFSADEVVLSLRAAQHLSLRRGNALVDSMLSRLPSALLDLPPRHLRFLQRYLASIEHKELAANVADHLRWKAEALAGVTVPSGHQKLT